MKRILTVVTGLLISAAIFAQTQQTFSKVRVIDELRIPRFSSLPSFGPAGALIYMYSGADSGLYLRNNAADTWLKMNGGGGSSYVIGNGLKNDAGTLRLADTLISSYQLFNPSYQSYSIINRGTGADRSEFYMGFGGIYMSTFNSAGVQIATVSPNIMEASKRINITYNNTGRLGNVILDSFHTYINHTDTMVLVVGSSRITIKNANLSIVADSLRFKTNIGAYQPTTTSTAKYKVVLMDSATGASVTASPALLQRLTQGTPSSSADSQGTPGDMLYDELLPVHKDYSGLAQNCFRYLFLKHIFMAELLNLDTSFEMDIKLLARHSFDIVLEFYEDEALQEPLNIEGTVTLKATNSSTGEELAMNADSGLTVDAHEVTLSRLVLQNIFTKGQYTYELRTDLADGRSIPLGKGKIISN